jgi:hypothetical protein
MMVIELGGRMMCSSGTVRKKKKEVDHLTCSSELASEKGRHVDAMELASVA